VRTEEAGLLGGDVLVEAPTLEEIAVHVGAGSRSRRGAGRHQPEPSLSTGEIK
jgi:hypothetical protein